MLSGSALALTSGRVDVRESSAVDVGSAVGLGSVSGRQVGHTGSGSATFDSGNPVPPERVLNPDYGPVGLSKGYPLTMTSWRG